MQNGALTSNRPGNNTFVKHAMPHFIGNAQIGDELRFFRRNYTDLLSLKKSQGVKKYQDYEYTQVLRALCDDPDAFETHLNRGAMSVIFSAVYGVRVSRLDHPLLVDLHAVWQEILKCMCHSVRENSCA
jgi:hypothetical protein